MRAHRTARLAPALAALIAAGLPGCGDKDPPGEGLVDTGDSGAGGGQDTGGGAGGIPSPNQERVNAAAIRLQQRASGYFGVGPR